MKMSLARRTAAEFIGTSFFVAAVRGVGHYGRPVGCGKRGHRASRQHSRHWCGFGRVDFDIRTNFGGAPQSRCDAGPTPGKAAFRGEKHHHYVLAQIVGGVSGAVGAHLMFGLSVVSLSQYTRSGPAQWFSEFVATFGLLSVIWGCSRLRSNAVPFAVGAYITAAYWFTASTSFANPAVTIAKCLSDTFAGIRPVDVPWFVFAQFLGGFVATVVFRWLVPNLRAQTKDVLVVHNSEQMR